MGLTNYKKLAVSLLLPLLVACDAEGDPDSPTQTESDTSAAGSDSEGGALDAQMQCEAASSASECETTDVGPDYGCVWGEVRVYTGNTCGFSTTERCIALDAFEPGPPSCPPLSGCENPSESSDALVRPVFRTLEDGTIEVVDTCAPYEPVGAEPPFVVCGEPELSTMGSPCNCACSPPPE